MEANSHVTALTGVPFGQKLWCLPFLHTGIIPLSGSLVLPGEDPM